MKKYSITGLALFFLAFGIFSTLTMTWDRGRNKFFVKPEQNKAFALQLSDCVCCHGSTVDRHHRLATNQAFPCTQCHQILYDPITLTYTPQLIRDCTVCHTIDTALLDRHHVTAYQASCFTCHQMVFDPATQSYYITLLEQCTTVTPPPGGQTGSVSHYAKHTVTPNNCISCHLCNLFDQHGEKCDLCHASTNPAVQAAIQTKNTQCTACHPPSLQHSMQCNICHTDKVYDPTQRAATHKRHMVDVSCGVCHEIPETTNLEPTGQYCALCHSVARKYNLSTLPSIHRTHTQAREYFPYSCYMCHGQAVPQTEPKQCIPCHDDKTYNSSDLKRIHYLHNRRFDCSNCHYNPRLFGVDQSVQCLRCHEARPYTSVYWVHAQHLGRQCWSCHASENVSAKAGYTCASCHGAPVTYTSTRDLHRLHDGKAYQCWVCHQQLTPMYITTCEPLNSPRNGTIAGTVTGANGAALNGATVFTNPGGFLAGTASDGTYSLLVDSDVTYTVTALKTGYDPVSTTTTVLSNQSVTENFMLPALPPGTISGKVTRSTGTGLGGVTIKTDIGGYRTTTALDGAYSLSVAPATYVVTATKVGYAKNSAVVTVSPSQTVTTNLILTTTIAKGTISGKVTDDSGLVALSGAAISTDVGGYTTTTAADGTYALAVNPGTYIVIARKLGYATDSKAATVYSYQTAKANIAMVTLPPGTISGKVTNASTGVAIAGATVSTSNGSYVTTTAADGTYSLTVTEGTYTVTASQGGYNNSSSTVTVTSTLTTTANITLTAATTTGTISGKVTDSGGAALAGATISTNTGGYTATTAADGAYSLIVITGTYTVTASKSGYNNNSTTAAVAANQTITVNFTLTTTPATGTISGTVTDCGSPPVPISGVTVIASGTTATTNASGAYSLSVAAGTYTVTASKTSWVSQSAAGIVVTTGAATTRNFTLTGDGAVLYTADCAACHGPLATSAKLNRTAAQTQTAISSNKGGMGSLSALTPCQVQAIANALAVTPTTGIISGKVTDSGGAALAGATISTNTGGYTATTAVDGTYSMTNVNAGTYTVTASKSGYNSGSATVTVAAGATVTQNFTLTAVVMTGKISGKVTDSKGTAVPGATVSTNTGGYTATTAADGTYTLTVNPGTYTVTASKGNYGSSSRTVTVQTNQSVLLNFALPAKIR